MGLLKFGANLFISIDMVLPHTIDTKNTEAVVKAVKSAFAEIGAESSYPVIDRVFEDVSGMFTGHYPGYQAIDMQYHDFEHTLQATLCLVHIFQGRSRTTDRPIMTTRDWELCVMAALLHDSGYLKKNDDTVGTGAKYTFVHERRSCEFARDYLPRMGVTGSEIEDICSAIICTGPKSKISQVTFRSEEARYYAFALVTADYLAQMSAPDYLDKLTVLYREFEEVYEFEHVPLEKRPYHNLDSLLKQTPAFWTKYVRPMLQFEAGAMYRYLSTAGQPNPYLQAVEANMEALRNRIQLD